MFLSSLDGQPVHVRVFGDGPPLVLLHANPGDSRDFDALIPHLSPHFQTIAIDFPGYGLSPAPLALNGPALLEWAGADAFLRLFESLAEQLGLKKFTLLGNSVGGNVAARYALSHPERVVSLILVSPGGFTAHNPMTRFFCKLQSQRWFKKLQGDVLTRLYLKHKTPATRAMLARAGGEQSRPDCLQVNCAVWASFLDERHDLREQAKAIACPVLLVSGKSDPVIPARSDGKNAAAAMPHAQWHVLPCGHAPFAEIPDQFAAILLPFLGITGASTPMVG
ncbi:MAG: alpha/beta hydrolase [Burkholderiales bacterium]|jgi:pimeloyl-ACP methyl ester carboxylesterase|nr:alpha/beta hydrolase [Burkholderiales bacterium]